MFVCCKRCERFILVSWLSLAEFGSGSPPDTVAGCCKRAEVQDELKQRKKKAILVIPGGIQKDSERFGKNWIYQTFPDISRYLVSHIRLTCRMFWAVLSRFVVRAHSKEASLPFANSLGIRHAVRFVIVPRYRSHGLNSEVIYLMSTHPFESHCGMLYRMLFGWHERSAFLCKRCVRAGESNIPARC